MRSKQSILITGIAGFIGYHLGYKLIEKGFQIIGVDNMNSYYDTKLKEDRLKNLINYAKKENVSFHFYQIDIKKKDALNEIFSKKNLIKTNISIPETIVNLAAQAGVRYSIKNPSAYFDSNLLGFGNILELSRSLKIRHLVYASSSSVYGGNEKLPFSEKDSVDHPVSLYAATKKANELMAHSYSHLYGIPSTGLRFFTVYGPWGRPDMAMFLFTKAILNQEYINVFNNGNLIRDFTYIDDIVESLIRILFKPAEKDINFNKSKPNPSTSWAPHRVFNIGNSDPVPLMEYIEAIEDSLEIKSKKNFLPMQLGDVKATSADTCLLNDWIQYAPQTSIKDGVKKFIDWYLKYYKIDNK